MEQAKQQQCICEGTERFRPSDWTQRLAGMAAVFGADQRLRYSPYLAPVQRGEQRCVRLDRQMATEQPGLYQAVVDFARSHGLVLHPVGS